MTSVPTNILDDLRLLEAPSPFAVWNGLAVFFAVVLAAGLILWFRQWARSRPQPAAASAETAQEDALAELEKLRALITVQNSRIYAIGVSGVVRRYIERRFGLVAPRRSTEEFLMEAQASVKLDERHRRHLAEFLGACDFLKFARAFAELQELDQIHQTAARFIADTLPAATTPRSSEGGEAKP